MIEFRDGRVDAGDGAALVQAMRAEMRILYEGLELTSPKMPSAGPRDLSPPGGAFLVGYLEEQPVCCGGIKRLDDQACELKRMFVVAEARSRGVGRELLAALEARARDLGYRVARLDTGPRQPLAQAFYERSGFRRIGNFNGNPVASFFGEKPL